MAPTPDPDPEKKGEEEVNDDLDFVDEVIDEGGNEKSHIGSDGETDDEDEDDGPVDARGFIEQEAELSGDGSSDEEEEDDDEELEGQAEADAEDVGDETEQREAIAKYFHKQQADEDKRSLLLMQERMFEDGDLHMFGKTRKRKFRWRNVEKTWLDPNDHSSDEDEENQDVYIPPARGTDQVIVHFKSEFPDEYDENGQPIGTKGDDADEESGPPVKRTKAVPVFGGPANSIKSYVVYGKAQNEKFKLMGEQEQKKLSPARQKVFQSLAVRKKHKIRTKKIPF